MNEFSQARRDARHTGTPHLVYKKPRGARFGGRKRIFSLPDTADSRAELQARGCRILAVVME